LNQIFIKNSKSFIIIGAGHFGRRAVEKILKRGQRARIKICDINPIALDDIGNDKRVEKFVSEGIEFLLREMNKEEIPDLIIPAIPVHVAFEFVILSLSSSFHVERIPLTDNFDLPNPFFGRDGNLYVSYADFLCPDDCPEPVDRCFATGKKREFPIFDRIGKIHIPDYSVKVIRSHQIAPGVGGYPGMELKRIIDEVEGSKGHFIIGTACRCHGVLSGLLIKGPLRESQRPYKRDLL
jgi:hypothetical protein